MRRCFLSTAVGSWTSVPSSRSMVFEEVLSLAMAAPKGRKSFTMVWSTRTLRSARKRMRFLRPGLPQAPDDLEGGVGLAGAGGHDEQDAVLPLGDGFDGLVDGDALVVARLLAAAVLEVVLEDDFLPAPGPGLSRRGISPKGASGVGKASRDSSVSV